MEKMIDQLKAAVPNLPEKDQDFARSLLAAASRWRGLTDKQTYWAKRLIDKAAGKSAEPEQISNNLAPILGLFQKAASKLKHPAIVLSADNIPLRVTVAGSRSKYPGSLNVTGLGSFDNRAWYGRVTEQGTWVPGRDAGNNAPKIAGVLRRFAADPAAVAGEHGKITGCCCFCNRPLDDKRSVAVGYGPTCAENYGLTWG